MTNTKNNKNRRYSEKTRLLARNFYLKGHSMGEIQKTLDLPNVQILYNWAAKYDWEALSVTEDPAIATTRRYLLLVTNPHEGL